MIRIPCLRNGIKFNPGVASKIRSVSDGGAWGWGPTRIKFEDVAASKIRSVSDGGAWGQRGSRGPRIKQ
ncbi:MAG: hypothetical protein HYS05_16875 [Acidobacteria bacterium]|nr:hypothetical protein [Acidobacteriota bacterium]